MAEGSSPSLSTKIPQQWAQDRRDFASTTLAVRLRAAFAPAEDAVEIWAIAAAVERLDNMQRQSMSVPLTVVMQIFDRHDGRMVYSTPVLSAPHWGSAFWASCAFAGGAVWENESDDEARRRFWLWYLDTAIPRVLTHHR